MAEQTVERWNSYLGKWESRQVRMPVSSPIVAPLPVATGGNSPAATWKSAGAPQQRMYAAARRSRLNSDRPATTGSADSELATSLTSLRNLSRQLVRDNPYAKRARWIIVNNVIGPGIGLQCQVKTAGNKLIARVNDSIEEAWQAWSLADTCHTGGQLHFCDLERLAMGQVFEAGEVFIRKHWQPFGAGVVPYALEVIEPERLANESTPMSVPSRDGLVRMGVEVDAFHRPLYYWIREGHPGDLRLHAHSSTRFERVPARDIIHLRLIDRWPQTRGEPWLHTVIQRLGDMGGYTEAEIIAARSGACVMGFIKSDEPPVPDATEGGDEESADGGKQLLDFAPGQIEHLAPGEEFQGFAPNRPNAALDPFMRFMLREVAAGIGCSYESLSRDYTKGNYSNSRLALLDDRDLWRLLQGWFLRNFRHIVHREWLQQAVLAGAVSKVSVEDYANNIAKYEAARFKTRGWSWIDPTKEVAAYKEAVRCGFTTVTDVIAQTGSGQDLEDVLTTRADELESMAERGLVFDTDPAKAAPTAAKPAAEEKEPDEEEEVDEEADDEEQRPRRAHMFSLVRGSHV